MFTGLANPWRRSEYTLCTLLNTDCVAAEAECFLCVGTLDQDHIVRWSYSFVSYFQFTQALTYNTIRHITQDMNLPMDITCANWGPITLQLLPLLPPLLFPVQDLSALAVPGGIASTAAAPSPPIRVSRSSEPYWQALSDLAAAAAVGIVLAATHSFYLYGFVPQIPYFITLATVPVATAVLAAPHASRSSNTVVVELHFSNKLRPSRGIDLFATPGSKTLRQLIVRSRQDGHFLRPLNEYDCSNEADLLTCLAKSAASQPSIIRFRRHMCTLPWSNTTNKMLSTRPLSGRGTARRWRT